MIPKIIHQIWLGDKNKMPCKFMKTVKEMNSDWKYILWTDKNIGDLINLNQYDQIVVHNNSGESKYPKLADIIRYEKLYDYGGVYVDADSKCIKSFNDLINVDFFVGYENENKRPGLIANGIIGAIPKHPILKECIDEISQINNNILIRKPAFKITGTFLLTDIIQKFADLDIKIFPSRYFYPFHYTDSTTHSLDDEVKDCYTYQLWNSTIRNRGSIFKRVLNRMYRIFNRFN